jgi:hypothetical protein
MKPQLPAHCACITKIGKRTSGKIIDNFYSVTIG